MSELILVRHGQASFGAESYDKLSPTGVRQVAILAQHWQGLKQRFDVLYSGELRRQQETAELLKPVVEAPLVNVHQGLNEYNGDPLIRLYLRDHALTEGFDLAPGEHLRDRKMFQRVLEAASRHWLEDTLIAGPADGDFEPWRVFQTRVHDALTDIMSRHTGGSRVVVATSGGVIATALQLALQLPDNHAIATNWMVNNSSVTRLVYGRGKVSLASFNALPHLETPALQELITFR